LASVIGEQVMPALAACLICHILLFINPKTRTLEILQIPLIDANRIDGCHPIIIIR
jgi:hypothetical protein